MDLEDGERAIEGFGAGRKSVDAEEECDDGSNVDGDGVEPEAPPGQLPLATPARL